MSIRVARLGEFTPVEMFLSLGPFYEIYIIHPNFVISFRLGLGDFFSKASGHLYVDVPILERD
jgi:hypothetical protein